MSDDHYKNCCKSCKHFAQPDEKLSSCRRYPVYQNRNQFDTCGEYSQSQSFGALDNIVQSVTKETIQSEVAAMKPKAGRPKKNVA